MNERIKLIEDRYEQLNDMMKTKEDEENQYMTNFNNYINRNIKTENDEINIENDINSSYDKIESKNIISKSKILKTNSIGVQKSIKNLKNKKNTKSKSRFPNINQINWLNKLANNAKINTNNTNNANNPNNKLNYAINKLEQRINNFGNENKLKNKLKKYKKKLNTLESNINKNQIITNNNNSQKVFNKSNKLDLYKQLVFNKQLKELENKFKIRNNTNNANNVNNMNINPNIPNNIPPFGLPNLNNFKIKKKKKFKKNKKIKLTKELKELIMKCDNISNDIKNVIINNKNITNEEVIEILNNELITNLVENNNPNNNVEEALNNNTFSNRNVRKATIMNTKNFQNNYNTYDDDYNIKSESITFLQIPQLLLKYDINEKDIFNNKIIDDFSDIKKLEINDYEENYYEKTNKLENEGDDPDIIFKRNKIFKNIKRFKVAVIAIIFIKRLPIEMYIRSSKTFRETHLYFENDLKPVIEDTFNFIGFYTTNFLKNMNEEVVNISLININSTNISVLKKYCNEFIIGLTEYINDLKLDENKNILNLISNAFIKGCFVPNNYLLEFEHQKINFSFTGSISSENSDLLCFMLISGFIIIRVLLILFIFKIENYINLSGKNNNKVLHSNMNTIGIVLYHSYINLFKDIEKVKKNNVHKDRQVSLRINHEFSYKNHKKKNNDPSHHIINGIPNEKDNKFLFSHEDFWDEISNNFLKFNETLYNLASENRMLQQTIINDHRNRKVREIIKVVKKIYPNYVINN